MSSSQRAALSDIVHLLSGKSPKMVFRLLISQFIILARHAKKCLRATNIGSRAPHSATPQTALARANSKSVTERRTSADVNDAHKPASQKNYSTDATKTSDRNHKTGVSKARPCAIILAERLGV